MNQFKYLSIISMISISLLNVAMLFTYRLIGVGPFLVPGGIIVFSITYVLADIIAEVYGYNNAKLLIFGNFICILLFNFSAKILLFFPAYSTIVSDSAYRFIFNHSFSIILGYSIGFVLGDFCNAYIVSRLRILLGGKYFAIRSITSSVVGQAVFSIIVSFTIYASELHGLELFKQFFSTVLVKIIIISLLAYPSSVVVLLLRKLEGITPPMSFNLNPFLLQDN